MSLRRTVDLAGHVVTYSADSEQSMERLDWFFGCLPNADAPGELALHVTDTLATRPSETPPGQRHGPIERWQQDTELLMWHDGGAQASVTDERFDVTVTANCHDSWKVLRHVMFSGLSWWFERRGLALIHGAMIARDDDAALVLGETGHGKSTIALGALLSGWDLCSDDLVLVGNADALACAFGIPKRPSVDPAFAELLGLPTEPVPNDERMRVMLPASTLSLGWRRLRVLIVAAHHEGGGDLSSITHSDALEAVLAAYLESDRPDAVRRQLPCLARVAGLPAFELAHDSSQDGRLQRAAELFGTAWVGARDET